MLLPVTVFTIATAGLTITTGHSCACGRSERTPQLFQLVGSTGSRTCVNCVVLVLCELRSIYPLANVVGAKLCIYWPVSEDGMEPESCTLRPTQWLTLGHS
jgi:hypothetical protein